MNQSGSFDEPLRFAIANKRLIRVGYGGRVRVAEPHDYGLQGTPKPLVYQHGLATGPAITAAVGWRPLEVSKIEALDVLEETFRGSRGRSHRHHLRWEVIFARVT